MFRGWMPALPPRQAGRLAGAVSGWDTTVRILAPRHLLAP
jgi:hypothetical protein